MKKGLTKRGNMLVGNVVFIILNLVFLTILILFILNKGGGIESLEQSYAKQIALVIDGAQPGMRINIDLRDGRDANEEWFIDNYATAIKIRDNIVSVSFDDNTEYTYSFFNNVSVSYDIYPEGNLYLEVRDYGQ